MNTRSPQIIYASTFLLAGSVIQLEVALTRVFSVLTWHHFTYMIISIALLGFGAAGSYLTLRRRQEMVDFSPKRLPRYAYSYASTTVVSVLLLTQTHFEPLAAPKDWTQLLSLPLYYLLLVVPFFYAGLCLASILAIYSQDINRIYAADLLGASTGSLFSVAAIQHLGATNTIVLVALLASATGWMLATLDPENKPILGSALVCLLVLCLGGGLYLDPFLVYPSSSKPLSSFVNPRTGANVLDLSKWHVIARIDITKPIRDRVMWAGDLSPQAVQTWEHRIVFQDGWAPTNILRSDGDIAKMTFLDNLLMAAPYQIQENPRVLVIGIGGGIDALIAMYHRATSVTGVDVNPIVVQSITSIYNDYAGGLFTGPNVEIHVAEGRHFLSRDKNQYDVIQLTGVDTFTALSSGAYALTENYLYTVEAMEDFRDHLTPNGVLSFSRWYFVPPRETLRLAATMIEAMENGGAETPARHIVIISGPSWAETLMKNSPFTPEEVQAIRQWAEDNTFRILYDPFHHMNSEYDYLLNANGTLREDFYQQYPCNVQPSTDDRPFFFHYYKWSNLFKMNVETGHGNPVTRFPLGLLTLLLSLVQILLFAGFGIMNPLRRLQQSLFARPGTVATLTYFSALGLGFIFVEITLIQKLMVFLGGPTYSFSIALFAILLFSGLGSFFARQWDLRSGRTLLMLAGSVMGLILAVSLVLDRAIPHLLDYGLTGRAIVAVLIVAPLAFTMGMPFPLGIRILTCYCPDWIPWAWGTNSFMSVFGSIFCIFLSMHLGFRWVFIIAGLIYLSGFVGFYPLVLRTGQAAEEDVTTS